MVREAEREKERGRKGGAGEHRGADARQIAAELVADGGHDLVVAKWGESRVVAAAWGPGAGC